ncbi:MAG: sensor histidine kinase [Actinomycetota bacterium]
MEKGDRELYTLLEIVSHELRSPLTSIKGFASTLVDKWERFDDATKRSLLDTINKDADRITRLVGELLDLSRLEAGRLILNKKPVKPAAVAQRVVEHIADRAPEHELKVEIDESIPDVLADPDKVEQVLTNLVENAVKYTAGGTVTIASRRATRGESNGLVEISVTDQGEGIPAPDRDQIFAKFFRRQEGLAKSKPGSGLGLYICRGLVEAQGGSIWVDDAQGGGAAFAFTLPAAAQ